jgi:hypothetical protein
MAKPAKLDRFGLRDPRQWPRLQTETQDSIREYLAAWYVAAESAADVFRSMARGSPEPEMSLSKERYWRHVCSGISWLMLHLPHRQRYLECQLALTEGRLRLADPGQETFSSPAETPSPSPPTAGPAKGNAASKPPIKRSKSRSPKRTPGPSQP